MERLNADRWLALKSAILFLVQDEDFMCAVVIGGSEGGMNVVLQPTVVLVVEPRRKRRLGQTLKVDVW